MRSLISPFMAPEETHTTDRQAASSSHEDPNPTIAESVAPESKKPKHRPPYGDGVEPHNPFDADQAESERHPPATGGEAELQAVYFCAVGDVSKKLPPIETEELAPSSEESGRERLKRHRVAVAGSVWIPDIWGQEERMKDWIDCSVFDASLVSSRIMSARAALMAEGRRPSSSGLRISNGCKIYS